MRNQRYMYVMVVAVNRQDTLAILPEWIKRLGYGYQDFEGIRVLPIIVPQMHIHYVKRATALNLNGLGLKEPVADYIGEPYTDSTVANHLLHRAQMRTPYTMLQPVSPMTMQLQGDFAVGAINTRRNLMEWLLLMLIDLWLWLVWSIVIWLLLLYWYLIAWRRRFYL